MFTIILYLAILLFSQSVMASPGAFYFDPGDMHNMYGVNRFPTEMKDWQFDFMISPFYQHSSGVRDEDGDKTKEGNRLGYWDMIPLLWSNPDAAPKPLDAAHYPLMDRLINDAYEIGFVPEGEIGVLDPESKYSIPIKYEKQGLRFELDVSMKSGFGLSVNTGAVEYKQTPTFIDLTPYDKITDPVPHDFLHDSLMSQTSREALLAGELDYNLDPYETVAFEDTFAELYWSNRFKVEDHDGNLVANIAPYFGIGVWMPTGKKRDQDRAFSLPTGHDGFWGVTLEGALNFEFPKTVLLNIGGGLTLFETKIQYLRCPCEQYQQGIYPFKARIRRTFGPAWNINISLEGRDIIEHLSVYMDYLYSKHEHDTISICESDPVRKAAFFPHMLAEESTWWAQTMQLGFEYEVSKSLAFGASGQTHIAGMRVYKINSIMGTIKLTF